MCLWDSSRGVRERVGRGDGGLPDLGVDLGVLECGQLPLQSFDLVFLSFFSFFCSCFLLCLVWTLDY